MAMVSISSLVEWDFHPQFDPDKNPWHRSNRSIHERENIFSGFPIFIYWKSLFEFISPILFFTSISLL